MLILSQYHLLRVRVNVDTALDDCSICRDHIPIDVIAILHCGHLFFLSTAHQVLVFEYVVYDIQIFENKLNIHGLKKAIHALKKNIHGCRGGYSCLYSFRTYKKNRKYVDNILHIFEMF